MTLPLTKEDLVILKGLHKSQKDKKTADRIKLILLYHQGYTQVQIALILLLDEDSISNWIKKYKMSSTIEEWLRNDYMPYWGQLDSFQLAQVKNYIKDNIILDARQVIRYIEDEFGVSYSLSGMQNLLHHLGFCYKQLTLFPSKSDIEKQKEFVAEYEQLNNNLSDEDQSVFIDGVHPQHNTKSTKCWIEKGREKYILTNTGRNRININGAYNPNTQDVIIREDETINSQSTIKLFKSIEDYYPRVAMPNAHHIYVFADNARYYRSKLVKEFIKTSRIKLIFLPAYSPNLNLIERLWKYLRKKVINTIYYEKFESFRKAILTFFENISYYKDELKEFIGHKFHITEMA